MIIATIKDHPELGTKTIDFDGKKFIISELNIPIQFDQIERIEEAGFLEWVNEATSKKFDPLRKLIKEKEKPKRNWKKILLITSPILLILIIAIILILPSSAPVSETNEGVNNFSYNKVVAADQKAKSSPKQLLNAVFAAYNEKDSAKLNELLYPSYLASYAKDNGFNEAQQNNAVLWSLITIFNKTKEGATGKDPKDFSEIKDFTKVGEFGFNCIAVSSSPFVKGNKVYYVEVKAKPEDGKQFGATVGGYFRIMITHATDEKWYFGKDGDVNNKLDAESEKKASLNKRGDSFKLDRYSFGPPTNKDLEIFSQ